MINAAKSKEHEKTCDVTQGLILGPNLYEDYTAVPRESVFWKHQVLHHIYADDTQGNLPFHTQDEVQKLRKLLVCVHEIRRWLAANWLKFNDSNTEFPIFGRKSNFEAIKT